jgi:hypothetical protein
MNFISQHLVLSAGENIATVALRQPIDIEPFPQMIPSVLRIVMEEIEDRHGEDSLGSRSLLFLTKRIPLKENGGLVRYAKGALERHLYVSKLF